MMNVIVDFKNHHRYSEVEFLDTVQTEMKNFLMERVGDVLLSQLIHIGSRPSDQYFRCVCLFICLFVQSFSQPSLIRF